MLGGLRRAANKRAQNSCGRHFRLLVLATTLSDVLYQLQKRCCHFVSSSEPKTAEKGFNLRRCGV